MTAIDTNVLMRYLTRDDGPQFQRVLQMLNRKPFIPKSEVHVSIWLTLAGQRHEDRLKP